MPGFPVGTAFSLPLAGVAECCLVAPAVRGMGGALLLAGQHGTPNQRCAGLGPRAPGIAPEPCAVARPNRRGGLRCLPASAMWGCQAQAWMWVCKVRPRAHPPQHGALLMSLPPALLSLQVSRALPSEQSPTVSQLVDSHFVALEVVLDERLARELIPFCKRLGATGIFTCVGGVGAGCGGYGRGGGSSRAGAWWPVNRAWLLAAMPPLPPANLPQHHPPTLYMLFPPCPA